jgi:uncharacterized protein
MARPPNLRRIGIGCETRVFKPAGTPLRGLDVVRLDLDGLEAMRLADLNGLYHEAAAEQMGVSRPTFGRILTEARARVAQALVEGQALRIGGGSVVEGDAEALPCPLHWGGRRRGRGCRCRGRWAGDAQGTAGAEPAGDPPAGGTREREER